MLSDWYHKEENDVIWWRDNLNSFGEYLFSFDKKNTFNLFQDYPWKLTKEQKEMFDKENPYWANYFADRK